MYSHMCMRHIVALYVSPIMVRAYLRSHDSERPLQKVTLAISNSAIHPSISPRLRHQIIVATCHLKGRRARNTFHRSSGGFASIVLIHSSEAECY